MRHTLSKRFNKQTGLTPVIEPFGFYNAQYVRWLELKLQAVIDVADSVDPYDHMDAESVADDITRVMEEKNDE